ncbi:MAG: Rha family transcriptional regulator [Zhenhengia sp.]|uniref:Rha family transcriptional regulator n=1 Tax=Zhenhengia sp. TaxID=2944208 RepID=UPI0039921C40
MKITPEQKEQPKPIEEDLQNENGQIVVSSRMVAERFGKEHKNVLQNIEELIKGVAEKSADLFIPSKYQHSQNKQRYPEYLMTRDGFTLLAMGFTGREALKFKLAYIEAFNKMEEALKVQQPVLPTTYKDALIALVAEVEAKERLQLKNKQQQEVIEVMKSKSERLMVKIYSIREKNQ